MLGVLSHAKRKNMAKKISERGLELVRKYTEDFQKWHPSGVRECDRHRIPASPPSGKDKPANTNV